MIKLLLVLICLSSNSFAMQYCIATDAQGTTQGYGEGESVQFDPSLTVNCTYQSDAQIQAYLSQNPTPAMALTQAQQQQNIDSLTTAGYITQQQQTSLKTSIKTAL